MAEEEKPPDCIPEEWGEEQRCITVTLDRHETHIVQMAALGTSLLHAGHDCEVEKTADVLLDKVSDAIDTQVYGR